MRDRPVPNRFLCAVYVVGVFVIQQVQCIRQGGSRIPSNALSVVSTASSGSAFVSVDESASSQRNWVCRTSQLWEGCGTRPYLDGNKVEMNASCPADACCSKTACKPGYGCGSFCTQSWFLCMLPVFYHSSFSYGSCSCKTHGSKCPKGAACVDVEGPGGGARCVCPHGVKEDGKTCVTSCDLFGKNCGPGNCMLKDTTYSCLCPETHRLVMKDGFAYCRQNPCISKPCGPGMCIPQADGNYECRCPKNYVRVGKEHPSCVLSEDTL